jgi:hypothetical protein
MTLSFRNDFLTPKQRTILAKAVEAVNPPPQSVAHSSESLGNNEPNGCETTIARSTSSVSSSQRSYQPKSKLYSFSEAGSSISSAVAPLVSTLLSNSLSSSGRQQQQEEILFSPSYLKRTSDSLDKMRHHHDFQSGLL